MQTAVSRDSYNNVRTLIWLNNYNIPPLATLSVTQARLPLKLPHPPLLF